MLNKLLKRFTKEDKSSAIKRYNASSHTIDNQQISRAALEVTETLQKHGFSAYIVGGGVRDLLLDGRPKDFDIATDATPEQVVPLFKRARLIGRRFKIVHVRFGREIIEVTTFRAGHKEAKKQSDASQNEKGILLRDNVYGDIESDALRRDFTVNALYYDPAKREILDYTDGVEDLKAGIIRIIGDADDRYKEDPVRMLRALRFSAKLGFEFEPATEAPIRKHSEYLDHIPPARLFEEVLKLFMSGYAAKLLDLLHEYHLLQYLIPVAANVLNQDADKDTYSSIDRKMLFHAAGNTDKRILGGKRVTPAFIYAAMMWPAVRVQLAELTKQQKLSPFEAMNRAAQGAISQQLSFTAIPKRFIMTIREIWDLQNRLPRRQGHRAQQTAEHPRFRAAYDFLLLRESAGEQLDNVGSWWTRYQVVDTNEREEMVNALGKGSKRPRRRKRKPASPPQNPD